MKEMVNFFKFMFQNPNGLFLPIVCILIMIDGILVWNWGEIGIGFAFSLPCWMVNYMAYVERDGPDYGPY